jgi:hypothetical protein
MVEIISSFQGTLRNRSHVQAEMVASIPRIYCYIDAMMMDAVSYPCLLFLQKSDTLDFDIKNGDAVRLAGFRTPTFTTSDPSVGQVNLFNLNLSVTGYSDDPASRGGDWITGVTKIVHRYSGPGPYHANFAGCCVQGMSGTVNYNLTLTVDMNVSPVRLLLVLTTRFACMCDLLTRIFLSLSHACIHML